MVNCDAWMNINLSQVIVTSADGSTFKRIPEIYLRGNNIKYLRIPEAVVDKIVAENKRKPKFNNQKQRKRK